MTDDPFELKPTTAALVVHRWHAWPSEIPASQRDRPTRPSAHPARVELECVCPLGRDHLSAPNTAGLGQTS